jgi:hypothetical protein
LIWQFFCLQIDCKQCRNTCFAWPHLSDVLNVVWYSVMSSTSKITKGDKQMYLMWTVPITHLRHAFIQCCASFLLLRWEYLYAMAAAIKNMDSAVTWPRYQTEKSEGSRVQIIQIFGNCKKPSIRLGNTCSYNVAWPISDKD